MGMGDRETKGCKKEVVNVELSLTLPVKRRGVLLWLGESGYLSPPDFDLDVFLQPLNS